MLIMVFTVFTLTHTVVISGLYEPIFPAQPVFRVEPTLNTISLHGVVPESGKVGNS